MADWQPDLYLRFERERTRPARDLLAAVDLDAPRHVVDLGCGPGNSTELLAERWPQAEILGIDTSPAMLRAAAERLPRSRFEAGDAATWTPREAPDLIFANAVLQWVPNHAALMPRLFSLLAPGGVLAVQMPDNLDEPSHRLMREVAAEPHFAGILGDALALRTRLLDLQAYYDLLAPGAAEVEVWRTVYHHPMTTPAAIIEWLSSTGLKPFVEPLPEAERTAFLERYEAALDAAYPRRADGQRLLAFPRSFIAARRLR
ncbi:trans-aconitate 2-methyltransferase [Aurantimonas sp. MSK8Z-1]|uniref:trans-aconitate 2-methyltransferase n=1 Tax=Mangrovibrevibacter kandeliae TaxID=2968473 RepID=UPI00211930E6|nr:trans-aconitate 2-methyltransferase [Aurantimonas sp. MSK8Z-1]MCW4116554.1 trans-aconitate 2-methyltransferase [Aurantimonas sp. MSK8Z-1]